MQTQNIYQFNFVAVLPENWKNQPQLLTYCGNETGNWQMLLHYIVYISINLM